MIRIKFIFTTNQLKTLLVKNYNNNNDITPGLTPPKLKKEYLYIAGIAIMLIILINNR